MAGTAYVMLSGVGLLLGGRGRDALSRRGVFLAGLALFTLASVGSWSSPVPHRVSALPRSRRRPCPW